MNRRTLLRALSVGGASVVAGCGSSLDPNTASNETTPTVSVTPTDPAGAYVSNQSRGKPGDVESTPIHTPTPEPPDVDRSATPVPVEHRACENPLPYDESGSFTFSLWIENQTQQAYVLNPEIEHTMAPECTKYEPPCSVPEQTVHRLNERYELGAGESIQLTKSDVPLTRDVDSYLVRVGVFDDDDHITGDTIAGWESGVSEFDNQDQFGGSFRVCQDTTEGVIVTIQGRTREDVQMRADENARNNTQ